MRALLLGVVVVTTLVAAEARPQVTIVNADTGARKTFTAVPTDVSRGVYEASVVFPSAGSWRYEVFDGFTPYLRADAHVLGRLDRGRGERERAGWTRGGVLPALGGR